MSTILVTGSNRGLGLEWVRQYAREGHRVYATCRHPSEADELQALSREFAGVSVQGMKALVDQFTMQDTGRFIRYDGVTMPW